MCVNVQSLIMAKEQSNPSSWIGGAEHVNCHLTQKLWRLKPLFSLSISFLGWRMSLACNYAPGKIKGIYFSFWQTRAVTKVWMKLHVSVRHHSLLLSMETNNSSTSEGSRDSRSEEVLMHWDLTDLKTPKQGLLNQVWKKGKVKCTAVVFVG